MPPIDRAAHAEEVKSALALLRTAKAAYHGLLCMAKPDDAIWIGKSKPPASIRERLSALAGGSKAFAKPMTLTRDGDTLSVVMPGASRGMAGRIQRALLATMGKRWRIVLGDENTDADDAQAQREEQARPADAAAPKAAGVALHQAPVLWQGTSELLGRRIGLLKDAVREHYKGHGEALLADIDRHLQKLDAVTGRLDSRLAAALAAAHAAPAAQRPALLAKARALTGEYMAYVKDEPLIDHIDRNPFGVATQIEPLVLGSLKQLQAALA